MENLPARASRLTCGPALRRILAVAAALAFGAAVSVLAFAARTADSIGVPGGTFAMGEAGTAAPEHGVTLTHAYVLDGDEVTNAAFRDGLEWALLRGLIDIDPETGLVTDVAGGQILIALDAGSGDNSCWIDWTSGSFSVAAGKEGWPVTFVTWFGAASYCDWRSGMEGRAPAYDHTSWQCGPGGVPYLAEGYRLPTEAEWEFAAQYEDERRWPWGGQKPDGSLANYLSVVGHPSPVGSYPAGNSALGIRDLAGNVWEWVNDWWAFYDSGSLIDPAGPPAGSYRSIRGGGWLHDDRFLRVAARGNVAPSEYNAAIGFRCARTGSEVPVRGETWGSIKSRYR